MLKQAIFLENLNFAIKHKKVMVCKKTKGTKIQEM